MSVRAEGPQTPKWLHVTVLTGDNAQLVFPSVRLGRPVDILAVIYICHIGTNGSRATSRLKITTISVAHSIATPPPLRPPSTAAFAACWYIVVCSAHIRGSRESL